MNKYKFYKLLLKVEKYVEYVIIAGTIASSIITTLILLLS